MLLKILIFLSFLSTYIFAAKITPLYELKQGFGKNEIKDFKRFIESKGDNKKIKKSRASLEVKKIFRTIRNQILTSRFS